MSNYFQKDSRLKNQLHSSLSSGWQNEISKRELKLSKSLNYYRKDGKKNGKVGINQRVKLYTEDCVSDQAPLAPPHRHFVGG
jgi:hypothetical protein